MFCCIKFETRSSIFNLFERNTVPSIGCICVCFRLTDFQQRYALYDAKRKTLDSVSKLFGIHCKPFPELDKTGEVRKIGDEALNPKLNFDCMDKT